MFDSKKKKLQIYQIIALILFSFSRSFTNEIRKKKHPKLESHCNQNTYYDKTENKIIEGKVKMNLVRVMWNNDGEIWTSIKFDSFFSFFFFGKKLPKMYVKYLNQIICLCLLVNHFICRSIDKQWNDYTIAEIYCWSRRTKPNLFII